MGLAYCIKGMTTPQKSDWGRNSIGRDGKQMKCKIIDPKYHFITLFDDKTGAYVRTGIIKKGRDTGEDPFMASFPHLIDVGGDGPLYPRENRAVPKSGNRLLPERCSDGKAQYDNRRFSMDRGAVPGPDKSVCPGRLSADAGNRILQQ